MDNMAAVLTRRSAEDDFDLCDIQVAAKWLPSALTPKQRQHKNRSRRETEKNCHCVGGFRRRSSGKRGQLASVFG